MAKKLMINCATCDARNALEENYAHYEQITLNCATVLASPQAKAVMNKLPFTLNCANVVEVDSDADLRTINGKYEIKSSDAVPAAPYFLMVNGSLTIGPDTQAQLARCVGMHVNGSLICPESVSTALAGVQVNGSTTYYPDGAVVLKPSAVIDNLFALRAKNRLYWARRRVILVDPQLNAERLKATGATFSTREAIVAQSKLEALVDLIDEQAEIIPVPDNTAVVLDDLTLDADALRRYGNQLYVIGTVTVPETGDVLDHVTYLNVRGDVKVPQARKEKLMNTLTDLSGQVKILKPKGASLTDKPAVTITRWMLEQQPQGVDVIDCAVVNLAEDISKELIVERLHIEDCAVVHCTRAQEDAVAMVCTDVGAIGSAQNSDGLGIGDILRNALGGMTAASDTKVINAASYVL